MAPPCPKCQSTKVHYIDDLTPNCADCGEPRTDHCWEQPEPVATPFNAQEMMREFVLAWCDTHGPGVAELWEKDLAKHLQIAYDRGREDERNER